MLISFLFAHSPGLLGAGTLQCLQREERWLERAVPVESPLPIGREWRKGEGLNEGQQVNIFIEKQWRVYIQINAVLQYLFKPYSAIFFVSKGW